MNPLPAIVLAAALANPQTVTLDDAVRAAAANQPTVAAAHASTAAASARADEAEAPLFPQVVANASYERATANGAHLATPGAAPAAPTSFSTYGNFDFGVTATQLVYDFGQTTETYKAAKQGAEAQAAAENAAKNAAVAAARAAFFQARAARELTVVAEGARDNEQKHLDEVQAFVDAKARPPIDLYQAKQDFANAEFALSTAEGNYEAAKATLNQAMGVEQGTGYDVS
ncbi:MAG TPA: TolC family protein, partial [Minicystis sp.]|nr:TolC family protein [Minicystis sp.]